MSVLLIDSHCHLDDDRFDADREQVIQRAHENGVQQFIIAATIASRWPKVRDVSTQNQGIHASYGLHPMFMSQHTNKHLAALDAWLDNNQAVAVGECGLDFYTAKTDETQQLKLLRGQLAVAANHQLPVIIHARKAMDLVLREIRQSRVESGVIHSFSGSLQQAQQLVALGFKLGIAATVSFERASKLRDVVSAIDLEALLIESDAPDQSGEQHRGQRNEPAFIVDHLNVMAELRDMSRGDLARHLSQNTCALFDLG